MSKIIYQPKGKAQEYARWAANFYNGCSGCCTYCYNRKGITAKILGGDKPTLKKSLKSKADAAQIFVDEIRKNKTELQRHGLFFNFVSDPCLKETYDLNFAAWWIAIGEGVPVIVLTKQTWWVEDFVNGIDDYPRMYNAKNRFAFGFTLTGHDELEPGCAPNEDRIRAMKLLNDEGFKTWASIEPIIDFLSSWQMIEQTLKFCDLYKIGLRSGGEYEVKDAQWFAVKALIAGNCNHTKVYLKDSLIKLTGYDRATLKEIHLSYVDTEHNIFTQ